MEFGNVLKRVNKRQSKNYSARNFDQGKIVEIRNENEILSCLDKNDAFEGLHFIPEMRMFCGQKFEVLRPVGRIIVEVPGVGMRRINRAVILKGVECNGEAHGGCNRTCLLLWKEAWLRKTTDKPDNRKASENCAPSESEPLTTQDGTFSCQSTNLIQATSPVPKWNLRRYIQSIRQHIWDLRIGELGPLDFVQWLMTSITFSLLKFLRGGRYADRWLSRGRPRRTPSVALGLRPGELVRVKSKKDILATLDFKGRNRGLEFNPSMSKYCGGKFRVLKRVDRMINEQTGAMRPIANTVLLEGATCDGKYAGGCQRTCYCLWREIWLERAK